MTAPGRTAGLVLVALLALLVHARALGGEFFFDDLRFVVNNPRVAEVGNPVRFFTDPSSQDPAHPADIYRPLRTLVFAAERSLFGLEPAAFHAVQVLLHAACAALVYLLLIRFGIGVPAAAAGGALFAVHPAQVEAVAWISSLADGMAAFFTLLSVHAWLRSRGPDRWYVLSLLAGLLACLSKEAAIVFPLFLVLVDLVRPDGGGPARVRAAWTSYVAPLLVAGAYGLVVRGILVDSGRGRLGHYEWWGGSWGTNLLLAAEAAACQGVFTVLPFRPSTEWYIVPPASLFDPLGLACLLGVGCVLGWALRAVHREGREERLAGAGVLLFAAGGLMTSHLLFTVGIPRTDRFLYLPIAGAALVLAAGIERLRAGRGALSAVGVSLLAMAAVSLDRISAFRDVDAFWAEATAGLDGPRPGSRRIGQEEARGIALLDGGKPAEAREVFRALAPAIEAHNARWLAVFGGILESGMEIRIHSNLALAMTRCGDAKGALEALAKVRTLEPVSARTLHIEARALRTLGRAREAGWRIEESLAKDPASLSPTEAAEVLNEAAALRLAGGLDGAALRALRLSVALVPDPKVNAVVGEVEGIAAAVAARRKALGEAVAARPGEFEAAAAFVLYEGRGGSPADGRAAFRRVFGDVPAETPGVRTAWAIATMEADDREAGWRAADAYHRETLARAPGDAGALLGVARCREALGDRPTAVARWREVLALRDLAADARREAEEGLRRAGE